MSDDTAPDPTRWDRRFWAIITALVLIACTVVLVLAWRSAQRDAEREVDDYVGNICAKYEISCD